MERNRLISGPVKSPGVVSAFNAVEQRVIYRGLEKPSSDLEWFKALETDNALVMGTG